MGINKPIICEIAYKTFVINEFGMAASFVLLGNERGLVIDTGCGMYNIRELVDRLCPLPYDVALTHGHGDHVGSMDKWEKVWLHPADWDMVSLERLPENKAMLDHYPEMMAHFGSFEAYDIEPGQIHYPETLPELLPMEDGHIFDLGGRKVEVLHTPGHTPGECVLIDPFSRIAFTGDACNVNLGIRNVSINTALEGLLKLKAREREFDRNYNSHVGYGSDTFHRCMPACVLDECLFIMRGILDGTADVQTQEGPFGKSRFVKFGETMINF